MTLNEALETLKDTDHIRRKDWPKGKAVDLQWIKGQVLFADDELNKDEWELAE